MFGLKKLHKVLSIVPSFRPSLLHEQLNDSLSLSSSSPFLSMEFENVVVGWCVRLVHVVYVLFYDVFLSTFTSFPLFVPVP